MSARSEQGAVIGCRFAGVLGVVGVPLLVLSSVAAAGVWCGFASVLHMVRSLLTEIFVDLSDSRGT